MKNRLISLAKQLDTTLTDVIVLGICSLLIQKGEMPNKNDDDDFIAYIERCRAREKLIIKEGIKEFIEKGGQ